MLLDLLQKRYSCRSFTQKPVPGAVGEIIGAQGYLVSNVIAFGYPAQPGKPSEKKAVCDIVFSNHF